MPKALAAALLAATMSALPAAAEQQPLWEFGLGVGALGFADYRGSSTAHAYPIPVPYLLYNGKFLQSDRDGIRGKLFNQDWVEINISFDASTPVRNDAIRSGMPDLKSTVEAGPSVDVHLFKTEDGRMKLDLRMPLRIAATVQASPHIAGYTFTPRLNLDLADPYGYAGWHLGLLAGPLFADRRYHGYFYTVEPQYATPSRPQYQAAAGYGGTEFLTALSKRFPKLWVGSYIRYDTLSGAVFDDSPLVQRRSYWTAGIGFAWMIHTSAQLVDSQD